MSLSVDAAVSMETTLLRNTASAATARYCWSVSANQRHRRAGKQTRVSKCATVFDSDIIQCTERRLLQNASKFVSTCLAVICHVCVL